ncbi:MAG: hypothetical protein KFH98_10695 [Gemmatimonadetes bacterium]|nr:hypothetical protein [Gemmatimonadota bacterium]
MPGIIRARGRLLRGAAGVLAAALIVTGCEGSNLFEGEVAEEGPAISSLSVPGSAASGSTFNVQVTATAPRGVRFIEVRVSGAATDSIRDEFDGDRQVESTSLSVTASSAILSQVSIEAFVQDINGRNSPIRRATVNITGTGTSSAQPN